MGVVAGGVHFYIEGMIDAQIKRNQYLEKEIAAMGIDVSKFDRAAREPAMNASVESSEATETSAS